MSSPAPQVGEDGIEGPPPYNSLVNASDNPAQLNSLPPPYFQLENVFVAPPPDYYSIFVSRLASEGRSGVCWTCLRKTAHIVLSTVGCSVLLLVFMSVPIAMLVIGSIFVGKCPIQPNIPVFLVVAGIVGILKNLFLIFERLATKHAHMQPPHACPCINAKRIRCSWRLFNIAFNLFMLAWMITGNYWIYHVYSRVSSDGFRSCNEVVYKFAFGTITSSYIILVLVVTCVCCCGLCLKGNVTDRSTQEPEPEPDPNHQTLVERVGEEEEEEESGHTVGSGEGSSAQLENNDFGIGEGDLDTQVLTRQHSADQSASSGSLARTSYLSSVV